jgi:hypothetical protein
MAANKITFDVYAHVRHARQQCGDRIEQIKQVDWKDPRVAALDEIYDMLDHAEGKLERILKEDQDEV